MASVKIGHNLHEDWNMKLTKVFEGRETWELDGKEYVHQDGQWYIVNYGAIIPIIHPARTKEMNERREEAMK